MAYRTRAVPRKGIALSVFFGYNRSVSRPRHITALKADTRRAGAIGLTADTIAQPSRSRPKVCGRLLLPFFGEEYQVRGARHDAARWQIVEPRFECGKEEKCPIRSF
jgi:hypothetical protein